MIIQKIKVQMRGEQKINLKTYIQKKKQQKNIYNTQEKAQWKLRKNKLITKEIIST